MHRQICAAALFIASAPALSQDASAPAPPVTGTVPSSAAPVATQTSIIDGNTPLEKIVADPVGKAALEKNLPGVTTHPGYEQVKGMSLRQLLPVAQPVITEEKIAAFEAELKTGK